MKVKIGEITSIRTGKLDANAASPDGAYQFFTCSREPLRISTYSYDCECVLVAGNGDLNVKYYNGKFDAYQRTYIIEDNSTGRLYMPYLYFFMLGYIEELRKQAIGGVIKYIKLGNLTEALIELPTIEEQKKIVQILKSARYVIEKEARQIECLDELIKARFVELFVGKKYEIVKAGSIIKEMRNGVSPSTSGGHFEKVLTLSAITQGKFDDKAWKEGFFTDCPSAEKRITEDDFYICRGNGNKSLVGMGVYALENRPDLVFPDTVIAAHIDTERMVLPYLWIMWQQPEVRKQLESGARTTNGTYKINQKVISEIKIICPPINEQEVFADFIKQVNKSKVVDINIILKGGVYNGNEFLVS